MAHPKITLIGAGSTVFAQALLTDILSFPELAESHISLHDIDPERLRTSERMARKLAAQLDAHPHIEATTDRRAALTDASYAICMIQVGGYRPATVIDFDIPKHYGLRQTIADTLGIGGIMRAVRTIPVLLDICRDMEEVCPGATLLQYSNPMAMNCWAISRASSVKTVGLCHSVFHTANELARDIGVPADEINYLCAGINHMAFYLRFERNGEDLYPRIRQVINENRVPAENQVRYDIFKRLGYFVTESSEHFAEYTPWFIKRDRPDLIERYKIPLDEYIRRCEAQIAGWETLRQRLEGDEPLAVRRSQEYGAYIIHSMETGAPRLIYGNVPNDGLIDNLPAGCCVEVPCLVDKNGIQPTHIGALPPQLAALMATNINVQGLTVEATLTRRREHLYHAAMLDPHTAAELDLDQIWSMVDDLLAAHGDSVGTWA
ncbi:MAG TPA: alpha-glucosidase/alpha-galactosidase [Ktedonobacterales bacterium]|jgi:alpha-galactosidase